MVVNMKNLRIITLCLCLSLSFVVDVHANALVEAARKGDLAAVKDFLDNRGYEIDTTDDKGNNALMQAVRTRNMHVVNFLLSRGININAKNKYGTTALGFAAQGAMYDTNYNPAQVVRILIEKGADINAVNKNGETILQEICSVKFINTASVRLLLEHGAKVNVKNNLGQTPLGYAVMWGNARLARLLVEYGADVDVKGTNGYTPLLSALSRFADLETAPEGTFMGNSNLSSEDNTKMAELFLEKGADVNAKSDDGQTPLSLAQKSKNAVMIQLVKRYGAK